MNLIAADLLIRLPRPIVLWTDHLGTYDLGLSCLLTDLLTTAGTYAAAVVQGRELRVILPTRAEDGAMWDDGHLAFSRRAYAVRLLLHYVLQTLYAAPHYRHRRLWCNLLCHHCHTAINRFSPRWLRATYRQLEGFLNLGRWDDAPVPEGFRGVLMHEAFDALHHARLARRTRLRNDGVLYSETVDLSPEQAERILNGYIRPAHGLVRHPENPRPRP